MRHCPLRNLDRRPRSPWAGALELVPPAAIQELGDLTRTRKQLVREISQHSLRIQKVLEDANLKLGSVLFNVLGPRAARPCSKLLSPAKPIRSGWLRWRKAPRKKTAELR